MPHHNRHNSTHFFWLNGASRQKVELLDQVIDGGEVLDIGCGRGWYTAHLRHRGIKVVAADLVLRLNDRVAPPFVIASADRLPFSHCSFDYVLAFDVIEHVPNEAAVWDEICRVARHTVIISVPNTDDGFLPNYGLCHLHHIDKSHQREYDPQRLEQLLNERGFEIKQMVPLQSPQMPLVITEFFTPALMSRLLRRLAVAIVHRLVHHSILRNPLPGDWYCVATRREPSTEALS